MSALDLYCGELYRAHGEFLSDRTTVHLLQNTGWVGGLRFFAQNPDAVADSEQRLLSTFEPRMIEIDPSGVHDHRCQWALVNGGGVAELHDGSLLVEFSNPFINTLEGIPWEQKGVMAKGWIKGQPEGDTWYWFVIARDLDGNWGVARVRTFKMLGP